MAGDREKRKASSPYQPPRGRIGDAIPSARRVALTVFRRTTLGEADGSFLRIGRQRKEAYRKEAYRKAQGDLDRRRDARRYADDRNDHWPMGSGPAEATCKMIQARMKRSGMNWSQKGAEHLLSLRADYCSRLDAKLYPQS